MAVRTSIRKLGRLLLLAGLIVPLLAGGLRAAGSRLDPRLQALRSRSGAERAKSRFRTAVHAEKPEQTVDVFLRVRSGLSRSELASRYPKARFGAMNGRIVTAEVPFSYLDALEADPDLEYAEASVRYRPSLDVVRSTTIRSGVYLGVVDPDYPTFGSRTGSGVVIGIVDTGIDFKHGDFIDAAGQSRILYIWDQTDTGGPAPGGSFTYGSQWTQAQINNEIDGSPANVVRQKDTDGHGTHVAGIAAGDGSATDGDLPAGTFTGMAPDADIIMVKTTYFDDKVMDGVNYIIEKAKALGKRAVVNLSMSAQIGPHDGTRNFEQQLNTVAASTPVVVAMGNEQALDTHGSAVIGAGGTATFYVDVYRTYDWIDVEFWADTGDTYTVWVSTAAGGEYVTRPSGYDVTGTIGATEITISNGTNSHPSNDKQISITIYQTPSISYSEFHIQFRRDTSGGTGKLHGWIFDTDYAKFSTRVDPASTVASPAVADNVISAGSYCSKREWRADNNGNYFDTDCSDAQLGDISVFSNRGPTRDGRVKPDLAAPGHRVASALSADITGDSESPQNIALDSRHRLINGTSMATPVIAGLIALNLQDDPSQTPGEVENALKADARADAKVLADGPVPNNTFGSGKVWVHGCGSVVGGSSAVTPTTMGASSISWTWALITNATTYNVYYATDTSNPIASAASPPFAFTGLAANTVYDLLVKGQNSCGEGPAGASASTSTLSLPLSGPAMDVGGSSITVSYTPLEAAPRAASAFGYRLEASPAPDFSGALVSSATTVAGVSSLRLDGLTALTTYYLRLGTLNELGGANHLLLGSTFTLSGLAAPGAAAFSGVTDGAIRANWTLNGNPAGLEYLAQASPTSDFSGPVLSSGTRNLFASFGSLPSNTTYYFRVNPVHGPVAQLGSTSTLAAIPAAADPSFTDVFVTTMTVNWTDGGNPAGTRYLAEVSSDSAFTAGVSSSDTAATSLALSSLDANTTCYARIVAVNHSGLPSASITLATSTLAQRPSPPAGDPFAAMATSITVTWTALAGAPRSATCEGYRVEASTASDFSVLGASDTTSNAAASQLVVSGLVSGATYFVRVGALNWNAVPNFLVLGSTRTLGISVSTDTVTNTEPLIVSVEPPVPELTLIGVEVPMNALPAGTVLTVNASIAAAFESIASNQATITPLGPGVGADISAGGAQPLFSRPITIRMDYDPAWLPPGTDPKRLVIANFRDGRWNLLPTAVDTQNHVLRALTTHLSLFAPFIVTASSVLDAVQVFPIPWMPGTGDARFGGAQLRFSNLPADGEVRLFTILGELVWQGQASVAGLLDWEGRNQSGREAASGTYLAVITGGGARKVTRVVVIR
ncbi:MAG: S8 family serine peptidase [Elusimicrobiota bacterium]